MFIDLLQSRFGTRLFLVFAGCVLLPLLIFALFSHYQVSGQLRLQAEQRLRHASKNAGLALFDYLRLQEETLRHLGEHLETSGDVAVFPGNGDRRSFSAFAFVTSDGELVPLAGVLIPPPLPPGAQEHLGGGHSLLLTSRRGDKAGLLLAQAATGPDGEEGLLLGEIREEEISALLHRTLSQPSSLHLLEADLSRLTGSASTGFEDALAQKVEEVSSGIFTWEKGEEEHLAGYWSIFLKANFLAEDLIVLVSESRAEIMKTASQFTRSFIMIFLFISFVVMLATSILVRRSVAPLHSLKEATRRISLGQFEHRVRIDSGDEFELLGDSFNTMAERLSGHFADQMRLSQFGRTVLSALDRDRIIHLVLTRLEEIVGCRWASLVLLDSQAPNGISLFHRPEEKGGELPKPEHPPLTAWQRQSLLQAGEWTMMQAPGEFSSLLPVAEIDGGPFMVCPLTLKEEVTGALLLGFDASPRDRRETGLRGRQLADQIATAFSNADLMSELEHLSWGTLTALARAVDAKSSWTGGHSERVTALALGLGEALGLSSAELDLLNRAGLLHDIGKIGVPEQVLDKPGKLTAEEYDLVKQHPAKGARILEPIAGFREIIPIIEQHHEWYDGGGYPRRLKGEQISLGGRILAVADVFDALISDRPYRPGMPLRKVLEIIGEGAGRQFDPAVVEALAVLIEENRCPLTLPSAPPAASA